MNLLLLQPQDLVSETRAMIQGPRLQHLQEILKASIGDRLNVGLLNGLMGQARIESLENNQATLSFTLDQPPPAALPLTVVLALPRPKMLKRILKNIAELGIKQLYLINSYKVEKSYWQTPWLSDEKIHECLLEGLVQARDTQLPQVQLKRLFKPFVEDELPALIEGKEAFIAHPYQAQPMPPASNAERLVVIGPEGGFIPYEVSLLQQQGLHPICMGERIYRVENALTLLSTQLSHV